MDLPIWTKSILIYRDTLPAAVLDDVEKLDAPALIGTDADVIEFATFVRAFNLACLLRDVRELEGNHPGARHDEWEEAQRRRYLARELARVASARWWREKGWLYKGAKPDAVKWFDDDKRFHRLQLVDGRYLLAQDLVILREVARASPTAAP